MEKWYMPKYIAPLIFEVSKKKKCTIKQALVNKGWISNIKMVLVWPCNIFMSTFDFGSALMVCNFVRRMWTLLFGTSPPMGSTLRHRLTTPNSSSPPSHASTSCYVNFGSLQRSNSLLGWLFVIGYGRRIVLRKEVGIIVVFVHFASKPKRRRRTFSRIAAIPRGFGAWLRLGLVSPLSFMVKHFLHMGVVTPMSHILPYESIYDTLSRKHQTELIFLKN
jgi:hypothetical protein